MRQAEHRVAAQATAMLLGAGAGATAPLVLFLLPGGRPRRLGAVAFSWDIQAGGRPRLRPRPRASNSRLKIACSICSRSCFNSMRILATSILIPFPGASAGDVFRNRNNNLETSYPYF